MEVALRQGTLSHRADAQGLSWLENETENQLNKVIICKGHDINRNPAANTASDYGSQGFKPSFTQEMKENNEASRASTVSHSNSSGESLDSTLKNSI